MALITAANAREMAAKSRAARAARLEDLRKAANPPPPEPGDTYVARRLGRVRAQIDLIDERIEKAIQKGESKCLKELTDAQSRLAEIERHLAGRPLPGSRRPAKEEPRRRELIELSPGALTLAREERANPTPSPAPAPSKPPIQSPAANPANSAPHPPAPLRRVSPGVEKLRAAGLLPREGL